jgi:glutathione peroxidase
MMTSASIPTKNNCRRAATLRPRAESKLAGIAARLALLYPSTRILAQRPGDPEETRGKTMRISRTGISRAYFIGLVALLMSASLFAASSIYAFTLPSIDGKPLPLANFKGKVVLVVNVASRCGFTPQYSALESTYEKYKDQGFVILGFPANNFGSQEPGTNQEIKTFCQTKYSVTFPMYAKVSVKGDDQTPLYAYLTTKANPALAGDIKWNFTKFLVDRNGNIVKRFEPDVTPDSPEVIAAIQQALKQ